MSSAGTCVVRMLTSTSLMLTTGTCVAEGYFPVMQQMRQAPATVPLSTITKHFWPLELEIFLLRKTR